MEPTLELEFALGEQDQQKYGGPEWLKLDVSEMNDTPWNVLGPWERELKKATGQTITQLLVAGLDSDDGDGKKAVIWLVRKLAGVETPAFDRFDILPRRIRKRLAGVGDAVPPLSGSSEPSSADETSNQD